MDIRARLDRLYDWLVRSGMDQNGNLIMPWNHTDNAVEYAWMDLISVPRVELERYLETVSHPIDRLIIERTIEVQKRDKR
jgi:hypothetical protein